MNKLFALAVSKLVASTIALFGRTIELAASTIASAVSTIALAASTIALAASTIALAASTIASAASTIASAASTIALAGRMKQLGCMTERHCKLVRRRLAVQMKGLRHYCKTRTEPSTGKHTMPSMRWPKG